MYLSNTDELRAFCERAQNSEILAIDTEFLREKSYFPKLCLIQLATRDEIALADPLAIDDLRPLASLLVDTHITKIFHACTQDLEVLGHSLGVDVSPIFDTQLAAAFLGHSMQLGYGALVEAYKGVHLSKGEALTDWSKRPLDEDQLRYAANDVRYLPALYDAMLSQLIDQNRLSWLEPELAALADPANYRHEPSRAYLRLKRASSLTRSQLAVARELCAWRETCAAKRDIPRRWVMTDELVVELSKRAPRDTSHVLRIRGMEGISPEDAAAIVRAVKRGKSCPPEALPRLKRKPKLGQESESVVDMMYALTRLVAEKSGVAAPLIATRDDLVSFMLDRKSSPVAHSWRAELLGTQLSQLLSGDIGLTVKDGKVELL